MKFLELGLAIVFSGIASLAAADDWTQWRGNRRDGTWLETGVVDKLTAENLKVVWRTPIDAGYSGPTVADGRVFLMDRQTRDGQIESVRCLDAKTGRPIWQHAYEAIYTIGYEAGPRASVTIDEERAFALGSMGHLHCLDVESGNVIWKRDLDSDFKISASKRMPIWGIACSPIVFGDLLIVQLGGAEGAGVIGLDKSTGREIWRSLDDRGQYSSPVLVKQGDKQVLVCWTGDAVAGLNPETGEVYWRTLFTPTRMPIGVASPVIKDGYIFLTSFYDGSLMLKMNDDLSVSEVWSARGENERVTKALHSIISTPIWIEDHLYGVDSYGELRCLRASDGVRIWEDSQAVKRNRWATIHFVQHGEDVWMFNEQGELIIGRLSPQGFTEISRAKVIEPTQPQLKRRGGEGVCWSHPAFANQSVYVRNDQEIICLDVSK